MEPWNEHSPKASKIRPDPEKAQSLLNRVVLREERLKHMPSEGFASLLVEDYYEMIKELATALMSANGWKTTSHELLVGYLAQFHPELNSIEISLIDQLRVMRNDIAYRGITINPEYLERNQNSILTAIEKLKAILRKKLAQP